MGEYLDLVSMSGSCGEYSYYIRGVTRGSVVGSFRVSFCRYPKNAIQSKRHEQGALF